MAFRLYREETFQSLPAATVPEIQRVSLASLMLQLKQLGIQQPQDFDFMDRCFTPTPEHLTMPTLRMYKEIFSSCSALLFSTILWSLQSTLLEAALRRIQCMSSIDAALVPAKDSHREDGQQKQETLQECEHARHSYVLTAHASSHKSWHQCLGLA